MSQKIKAVLFDLDSTLVDSSKAICKSFNFALQKIGQKSIEQDRIVRLIGLPLEQMFLSFFNMVTEKDFKRFLFEYRQIYPLYCLRYTRLINGAKESLIFLKDNKIYTAIVTTKKGEFVKEILQRFSIEKYVNSVVPGDAGFNPKPAPDMILEACQRLNVPIENCILVGDSTVDIMAGKTAYVKTIGVLTGSNQKHELANVGADFVITSVAELPAFFRKESPNL